MFEFSVNSLEVMRLILSEENFPQYIYRISVCNLMLYKSYFLSEDVTIFVVLLGFVSIMSSLMYNEISL